MVPAREVCPRCQPALCWRPWPVSPAPVHFCRKPLSLSFPLSTMGNAIGTECFDPKDHALLRALSRASSPSVASAMPICALHSTATKVKTTKAEDPPPQCRVTRQFARLRAHRLLENCLSPIATKSLQKATNHHRFIGCLLPLMLNNLPRWQLKILRNCTI